MRAFWLTIKEILEVVVIAVVTVFIIRYFLIQPFLVSGASMEPNFSDGNYLLIDEVTYRFREPERGEVVVFRYPKDPSTFFIKRIIGLPGEKVVFKNGNVYINNIRLEEDYLSDALRSGDNLVITLKDDQYFVLGDNRSHSFDSRNWGPISKEHIIGIARLRILPVSELGVLKY